MISGRLPGLSMLLLLLTGCGGSASDVAPTELASAPADVPPSVPSVEVGVEPPSAALPASQPVPEEGAVDDGSDPVNELLGEEASIMNMLSVNCGECHGAAAVAAGVVEEDLLIESFDRLVEQGWILPLKSDDSALVQVVVNGSMPPPGVQPRPSARDVGVLIEYIDRSNFWGEARR